MECCNTELFVNPLIDLRDSAYLLSLNVYQLQVMHDQCDDGLMLSYFVLSSFSLI